MLLAGGLSGLVAALAMYALLVPVARGKPVPPTVFAARMFRIAPQRARVPGMILQLVFGLFWGTAAATYLLSRGPVFGSHPLQGLLIGVVAFVVSLSGFATLRLIPRPPDWREWTGHFLNHLVFGLVLGFGFLVGETLSPAF